MYDLIKDNFTTILVLLFIIIFSCVYYYLDVPRFVPKMRPECYTFPQIKPILNKNAKVSYETLPNGKKICIIDNVLDNIEDLTNKEMKQYLSTLGFQGGNPNYPGKQYGLRLDNPEFLTNLKRLLRGHKEFQNTQSISDMFEYSVGNEFKPNSPYTTNPHTDNEHEGLYACMIFLNKDDDCYGGTSIFKSKILNSMKFPIAEKGLTYEDYWKMADKIYHDKPPGYNIIEGQKYNDNQWELVKHMKMKYNRMVIYDACLFHSMDLDSFKHFKDGNRYTLNFWVDSLPFVRRDAYSETPDSMLKMGWISEKAYEAAMKNPDIDPIWAYIEHYKKNSN